MITSAVAFLIALPTATPGPPLPVVDGKTRAHLAAERFSEVRQVAKLPRAVREELARHLQVAHLEMADEGQPFQETDVITEHGLPRYRMVVAAVSDDHCIVHYEQGGIALFRSLAIFSWNDTKAALLWEGAAPPSLATAAAIQAAVRDGSLFRGRGR